MNSLTRILVTLLLALLFCHSSHADSFYWDNHLGFSPFSHCTDKNLIIHNDSDSPIVDTIPIEIGLHNFEFEARVANLNNTHDKRYKYKSSDASTHYTKHLAWSLIAFDDDNNSLEIKLATSATSDWEYTSNDCLIILIYHGGKLLDKKVVEYPIIEPFTKPNTIHLTRQNSTFSISLGSRYKQKTATFDIDCFDIKAIGFCSYPGAKIDIKRASLNIYHSQTEKLTTEWTLESIGQHLDKSTDPLEGYWIYRDRSLDEDLLRMGGNYSFALIKNGAGYDLIYIDGATINPENWKTSMIKASLKPTKFDGTYHLTWYDSEMRPLHKDITATFSNNTEMTINFPYQASSIRFHRSLMP